MMGGYNFSFTSWAHLERKKKQINHVNCLHMERLGTSPPADEYVQRFKGRLSRIEYNLSDYTVLIPWSEI